MPRTKSREPRAARYQRPWLYPKQLDALFHDKRYGVVEASTKAGKTVGCMVWLLEQALQGQPNQNFWWVAPVYRQAEMVYRRMKTGLPEELYEANAGKLTLTLANGAILWFLSAEKPDNLYGEDVHAAVIDEASRVREESWYAVRSTLTATRGPVRIIGNVKGRKNWAYKLARRAEAGEPDMHYAKIIAYDAVEAGVLTAYDVEDARQKMPEHRFRELYLAEPADDSAHPFSFDDFPVVTETPKTGAVVRAWDMAATAGAGDWTAGVRMKLERGVFWIEDVVRGQWGPTERDEIIRSVAAGDGSSAEQICEQEPGSAGKTQALAFVRMLAGHRASFERPTGSKITRAMPFASQAGAGNVRVLKGLWNEHYIEEFCDFPDGDHDDQVDATAMAFKRLSITGAQAVSFGITLEDPDEFSKVNDMLSF